MASLDSPCVGSTGERLLDMFDPDTDGNVALEYTASYRSIFVVCASLNIKLYISDTLQYQPENDTASDGGAAPGAA